MSKKSFWGIGTGLIALSAFLHYVHYVLFHDLHHTLIYLVADIAFIPLEVFFVTMVLDRFLENREKSHVMEKLNMLVGLFYNEIGTDLFTSLVNADLEVDEMREDCIVTIKSIEEDFKGVESKINAHKHRVEMDKINLVEMKEKLHSQKELLVNLISNPALLEHEEFSEMLMAVFHLEEELHAREVSDDQAQMKSIDVNHLKVDIERVYKHISVEWVQYMKHLKIKYPFLYFAAILKNPYDLRDEAVIETEILKMREQG